MTLPLLQFFDNTQWCRGLGRALLRKWVESYDGMPEVPSTNHGSLKRDYVGPFTK